MLYSANSLLRVFVNPMIAALSEFDRLKFLTGCFAAIEFMLIIRPHRRFFIYGATSWHANTILMKSWLKAYLHSSSEVSMKDFDGGPPCCLQECRFVQMLDGFWPQASSCRSLGSDLP